MVHRISQSETMSRYWKPKKAYKKIGASRTVFEIYVITRRLNCYIHGLKIQNGSDTDIKNIMLTLENKFQEENSTLLDKLKQQNYEKVSPVPKNLLDEIKSLAKQYETEYNLYVKTFKNLFHNESFSDSDPETNIPSNMTHGDFLTGIIPKKKQWDDTFSEWSGMIKAKHVDGMFFLSNPVIFKDLRDNVPKEGVDISKTTTIIDFLNSRQGSSGNSTLEHECNAVLRQFKLNEQKEILHDLIEYNMHKKYLDYGDPKQYNFESLIRTDTFLRLHHEKKLDDPAIKFFMFIISKFYDGRDVNIAGFMKLHLPEQWVVNKDDQVSVLQKKCRKYMSRVMPPTEDLFEKYLESSESSFRLGSRSVICTKWTKDTKRSTLIFENLLTFNGTPHTFNLKILKAIEFSKFKDYFNAIQMEHLTGTEEDFISNIINDAVSICNLGFFYQMPQ